jgi:hypothetical protein
MVINGLPWLSLPSVLVAGPGRIAEYGTGKKTAIAAISATNRPAARATVAARRLMPLTLCQVRGRCVSDRRVTAEFQGRPWGG